MLWLGSGVFLLVFVGFLLATYLRAVAGLLCRYMPVSQTCTKILILAILLGALLLGGWSLIPSLSDQFEQLSESIPSALEATQKQISQLPLGKQLLEQWPQSQTWTELRPSAKVLGSMTSFFSSAVGMIINLLLVLVVALYFAFAPETYKSGLLQLIPKQAEPRAREVLEGVDSKLRAFLLGISCSMCLNGLLTFVGLWWLGIPFAVPFALLAGLLSFVPNFGPILAGLPAVLIGFAESPTRAFYVVLVFLLVQNLDGFVFTPLIQKRATAVPPVLVITSQALLGILFGFLGLLLAVPLVAVLFELVKMLYVEDVLERRSQVDPTALHHGP